LLSDTRFRKRLKRARKRGSFPAVTPVLLPDSMALPDAAATAALGARVAAWLQIGDVVLLEGDLGAGKTTLARGLSGAWTEQEEDAPSPTYTLAQLYEGPRGALWHMDLYRLNSAQEVDELGLEEAFATAVTLIEWPDRLGTLALPRDRLALHLHMAGMARRVDINAQGRLRESCVATGS
jgi:tRNA threonylcarbamoyladenosine biosynthesis protein TsaE